MAEEDIEGSLGRRAMGMEVQWQEDLEGSLGRRAWEWKYNGRGRLRL